MALSFKQFVEAAAQQPSHPRKKRPVKVRRPRRRKATSGKRKSTSYKRAMKHSREIAKDTVRDAGEDAILSLF